MKSVSGDTFPESYQNLSLSGLMTIKDTPVRSESRTPPMVNKSMQTSPSDQKKVKFTSVLIRNQDTKYNKGEVKSVCIEELTILIKDIINNKSRPENYKNDDFIKNIL